MLEKLRLSSCSIFPTGISMNTTLATTQIKIQNWALIIKNQKNSGLKVIDYCSKHSISKDAYYYWYRKVKETALQERGFVELTQSPSVPAALKTSVASEFQIQYGDIQVFLPVTVPKDPYCVRHSRRI